MYVRVVAALVVAQKIRCAVDAHQLFMLRNSKPLMNRTVDVLKELTEFDRIKLFLWICRAGRSGSQSGGGMPQRPLCDCSVDSGVCSQVREKLPANPHRPHILYTRYACVAGVPGMQEKQDGGVARYPWALPSEIRVLGAAGQ